MSVVALPPPFHHVRRLAAASVSGLTVTTDLVRVDREQPADRQGQEGCSLACRQLGLYTVGGE